ncbi:MAG: hypothetical protein JZD41_08210 [Thermoproteus sp.]|nr:hypothetical protein [Thermoproteus sp.]
MARGRVEEFFRRLSSSLEGQSKRVTVDWRHDEALGQIQLDDDMYVFIVVSWAGDEYYVEYMIGDENAVIQSRHVDLLDKAVAVVKTAHDLAAKMGLIA